MPDFEWDTPNCFCVVYKECKYWGFNRTYTLMLHVDFAGMIYERFYRMSGIWSIMFLIDDIYFTNYKLRQMSFESRMPMKNILLNIELLLIDICIIYM